MPSSLPPFDYDFGGSPYGNPDDRQPPDGPMVSSFSADTFEKLELTREARRLATAERKKFEKQAPVLDRKIELQKLKLATATQERLAAEAQRDRTREARLLVREKRRRLRDRRLVAEAEERAEETKKLAALGMVDAAKTIHGLESQVQDEYNRRVLAELAGTIDEEMGDLFPLCDHCGKRMNRQSASDEHFTCPECGTCKNPYAKVGRVTQYRKE